MEGKVLRLAGGHFALGEERTRMRVEEIIGGVEVDGAWGAVIG